MRADHLVVEQHHRRAARQIVDELIDRMVHGPKPYALSIAGESDQRASESMDLTGVEVLIAQGASTSLLENVDTRIFIARNRIQSTENRIRNGSEPVDPFVEHVLEIGQEIIESHRQRADLIITRDYEVAVIAR